MTHRMALKKCLRLAGWTSAVLLAAALPAAAHPGHGPISGFLAGVQHPLSGMDHLLAMIAVGLWAGLCGGRREWLWPAAFVTSMIAGSAIGMFRPVTLTVEPMILASVMILGLVTAMRLRAPLVLGGLLIGVFGMAHGYAHGTEIPHTAHGLDFAAGFTLATATLHLTGLLVAVRLRQLRLDFVARFAGGAIVIAGIGLILGV
ncbi:MAG TPA: HupE/UreJ family protein [Rhizomicrobium sp.]|nr:HupE/UreJ family protein [Rhizomicrobium sp.]